VFGGRGHQAGSGFDGPSAPGGPGQLGSGSALDTRANLKEEELGRERVTAWKIVGGASVIAAVGLISWRALTQAYPSGPTIDMAVRGAGTGFGSVKAGGRALYIASVLPFEVTSLLLTVAIVGAVVVAKGKI